MGKTRELTHAEHSRYDPVKAHEYYERTKKLKGRSTKRMSDSQKEGWDYVKGQVGEEKKSALKGASESNKQQVEELRNTAEARRKEIQEKLKQIMEKIGAEGKATREQAKKKADDEIDALPDMPDGLNKQQRAEFSAKRRDEIAKIRGEQKKTNEDTSLFTKARSSSERESSKTEREQVVSDLKASFEKARKSYQDVKDGLKSKYESELDKEFQNIQSLGRRHAE